MKIKAIFLLSLFFNFSLSWAEVVLNNHSFPLATALFKEYNKMFQIHWYEKTGEEIEVGVINELFKVVQNKAKEGRFNSEVASFIHPSDIDGLVSFNLVNPDWREKFPNQSRPYYSTIAFLVRKGNPKAIKDWGDLVKPKVSYIFADPMTNHNPRFSIISALLYAQENFKNEEEVEKFMQKFALHLATSGDKGEKASDKFISYPSIDALLIFESEAQNLKAKYPEQEFEVIVPPSSILAEFSTAIVDKVVEENSNRDIAWEYVNYLYDEKIQDFIASKFHYRVANPQVMKNYQDKFPQIKFRNTKELGDYKKIEEIYFSKKGKWNQWLES